MPPLVLLLDCHLTLAFNKIFKKNVSANSNIILFLFITPSHYFLSTLSFAPLALLAAIIFACFISDFMYLGQGEEDRVGHKGWDMEGWQADRVSCVHVRGKKITS